MAKSDRIDVYLVAGGKYHNIDYARLEILKLIAEQPRLKVEVGPDYGDIDAICAADFIVTYTCDVMPTAAQTERLCERVRNGGRWLALHGTNSILRFLDDGRVDCPRENPAFMELLGSQFLSHPPIQPYTVNITEPDHPLVTGLQPFTVDDELYLSEHHGEQTTLLHTHWNGKTEGFVEDDWETDTPRSCMYLRPYGAGEVLYLTLGHCRGKYDMQPHIEEYPEPEFGAWKTDEYYELLRRGIRWAMGTL
ncbi:ThuA domain-containing protein [Halioglobus maricola]|uniref:ThuA domain-containing protein n=1 Tax=Halioglobus maricola TaxID=2601894 RepID=A0A5P9NHQ9_9GAMM|nr:ThuA domain-containing protein [Halioglobus maricola]QFU75056.1 ThuA domain-containing protein [Halioglobus maricola]